MAVTKICNLDLIAPVAPRQIVLSGVSYDVLPLSVAKFIEFGQMREKISASSSVEEGLKLTMALIKAAIPSLPDDVLNSMSLGHLQLVVAFINDEIPEEVLAGKPVEETAESAEQETAQGN